jgi:hypothetical protein
MFSLKTKLSVDVRPHTLNRNGNTLNQNGNNAGSSRPPTSRSLYSRILLLSSVTLNHTMAAATMPTGDQHPVTDASMDIDMDLDLGPEPEPEPEAEHIQTVSAPASYHLVDIGQG